MDLKIIILPRAILILTPLLIFILVVIIQTSYHYLSWHAPGGKQIYVPKGTYQELDSDTLKRLRIYIDPMGKYLVDNYFIKNLIENPTVLGDLSNIRFQRRQDIIFGTDFAAISTTDDYLRNRNFILGIDARGQEITFADPAVMNMIFSLETLTVMDLLGLAKRFGYDSIGISIMGGAVPTLTTAQREHVNVATQVFLYDVLHQYKPIKLPTNEKLGVIDFLRYTIVANLTAGSPDLYCRSKGVQNWQIFFTILTYFLLATQTSILASWWFALIP